MLFQGEMCPRIQLSLRFVFFWLGSGLVHFCFVNLVADVNRLYFHGKQTAIKARSTETTEDFNTFKLTGKINE